MERSATNAWTVAGGTLGVLVGLYLAHLTIGLTRPEFFFPLTSLVAMPFAAGANFLISRSFRDAGKRQQLVLAISGWIALFVSLVLLIVAIGMMLPRSEHLERRTGWSPTGLQFELIPP